MSFIDDLLDVGSSVLNFFTGNSTGSQIARTVALGYALNQITDSINKENEIDTETAVDPGVRVQVDPDTEYKIPVVYGTGILGGAITDARMTNNNGTMHFCLTLSEKTGNLNLGTGDASEFNFGKIYWDGFRLAFASNGIDVIGYYDSTGVFCDTIAGQVKVYCYGGDSTTPVVPTGYSNSSLSNAYDVMPGWDSSYLMTDTVFAIVRIDYSADKNVKGLGQMKFEVINSMDQPGDCMYDYMTNTRYGAGIDPTEIYSQ